MTDRPTDGPKDKASYIVAFCNKNMLLLDASPHLYMRVCLSGRGPSVARFFFESQVLSGDGVKLIGSLLQSEQRV